MVSPILLVYPKVKYVYTTVKKYEYTTVKKCVYTTVK